LATTFQRIGPDGGFIQRIVSDPRNPDVLYAEPYDHSLLKTIDGGDHWTTVYRRSDPNDRIFSVSPDAGDPSVLYALIRSNQAATTRIYQSTDGGAHWLVLPNQPPISAEAVTADPLRPGVLYASGNASVFRSTDGGLSWVTIRHVPLPAGYDSVICRYLGSDPARPGTLYLGVKISFHDRDDTRIDDWIEKSADGGSTWTELPPPTPCTDYYSWDLDLKFDPGDPGALFAIAGRSLFVSRDGAATWRKLRGGSSDAETVLNMAFGPAGSGYIYAGGSAGFFRSADGGTTWASVWNGLPEMPIFGIKPDPRFASVVLVNAGWTGMFKTTDGGASWVFSSRGLRGSQSEGWAMAAVPGPPSTLYVSTFGGLYKGASRGETWDWLWSSNHTILALAVHPSDASILYAFRTNGISKSLDGGRSWNLLQEWRIGLYDRTALVIDPVHPDTVYAAAEESPVFKTIDGGAHWTTLNVPNSFVSLVIDPANPAVLYAGLRYHYTQAADVSVHKSTDGGSTWTKMPIVDKTPTNMSVISLALDPADPRTLYAGTCYGIYKSTDGGGTWTLVLPSPSGQRVEAITVASSGSSVVYALYGKIVFRSRDGGAHWEDLDRGLSSLYFNKIAIDPSDSNMVYLAGPHVNGVFSLREDLPWLAVNRTRLNFGASAGTPPTQAQKFSVANAGDGILQWTAGADRSWIRVSPSGGTNGGTVRVSVDPQSLAPGKYTGSVMVEDPQAANSSSTVEVYLTIYGGSGGVGPGPSGSPFGSFDTPADGAAQEGSVPVTGWALDDIQVAKVEIWRAAAADEGSGLVYIGEAVFVEDARPDVEKVYPLYPNNRRAGWGYMMLTNGLPNRGNGTFVIHARATDAEGRVVEIGKKTIFCDNAGAVRPFGTIDTPIQGGSAFGSAYLNFGWALTPAPNAIPADGSTIWVWVDGVPLGHPVYGHFRSDIAALFPGYANTNGAVGYWMLDTTGYADGVHTIAWSVEDNAGNVSGLGSRYFTILNSSGDSSTQARPMSKVERMIAKALGARSGPSRSRLLEETRVANDFSPVGLKTGFSPSRLPEFVYPGRNGTIRAALPELGRIEIDLNPAAESGSSWSGFLLVGTELRPLPIGSSLDSSAGVFRWQSGPGFIGTYDLVFIRDGSISKRATIAIGPPTEGKLNP